MQENQNCGFDPWVEKIPWRTAWQPVQYSCLENPTDREATVYGITKSLTGLKQMSMRAYTQAKYIHTLLFFYSFLLEGSGFTMLLVPIVQQSESAI